MREKSTGIVERLPGLHCLYCNKEHLRLKQSWDWQPGEQLSTGFHNTIGRYLICGSCKKTCILSVKRKNNESTEETAKRVKDGSTTFELNPTTPADTPLTHFI